MREGCWEYKEIGFCFPYIKNGANIKQDRNAKGFPITRIETLSGGIFNRDRLGYANLFDLDKYKDYILSSHDLLMSHINSKTYIGRTVEYVSNGDEIIIHGMNLLRLKSNPEVIDSTFFAYYSHCHEFRSAIAKIRKDAVNQSSFAISDLKKIPVPVPPLSTQHQIVAELDLLSGILDKQKAQLKELDNLAQSIFYDMFGDPVENEKGWEVKKLGDIANVITGNTPSTKNAAFYDSDDYCFVKPNDINKNGVCNVRKSECHLSKVGFEHSRKLPKDSILITCIGIIGKVGILQMEATCNQQINAVVPSKEICSIYLGYTILALRQILEAMANAPVVPIINKGAFSAITIPLPPLTLQHLFAQKIEQIEQQKARIQQSIKETQSLFDYTMDKYFG